MLVGRIRVEKEESGIVESKGVETLDANCATGDTSSVLKAFIGKKGKAGNDGSGESGRNSGLIDVPDLVDSYFALGDNISSDGEKALASSLISGV